MVWGREAERRGLFFGSRLTGWVACAVLSDVPLPWIAREEVLSGSSVLQHAGERLLARGRSFVLSVSCVCALSVTELVSALPRIRTDRKGCRTRGVQQFLLSLSVWVHSTATMLLLLCTSRLCLPPLRRHLAPHREGGEGVFSSLTCNWQL